MQNSTNPATSQGPDTMSESLSEIAKLLEAVKGDLSRQMSDQAESLENTFKQSIERQDNYEKKSDQRFKQLEEKSDQRFKQLEEKMANLTELVKDRNPDNYPPVSSTAFQQPPPPPPYHSPAVALGQGSEASDEDNTENKAIKDLISDARCVIGIGPMYQYHYDKFGDVEPDEAVKLAAIDALRLELNVRETEIAEEDIKNTFLPIRPPKVPRVYIRFHKQEHADLCLKLAKSLRDSDVKIFRYFPRQFQARVRALEDAA